MKKILEHPIISTVVASVILSFLGWLSGVLPDFWSWLKSVLTKLIDFMVVPIEVPLWILLVICVPMIAAIVKQTYHLLTKYSQSGSPLQENSQTSNVDSIPEKIELTEEENEVLRLLVEKDGAAVEMRDLKYRLNIPRLRGTQILEALSALDLIQVHDNPFHGPQIYLTNKGRDFVLGNKYARN